MFNISFLTGNEIRERKNIDTINKRHKEVFGDCEKNNPPFYVFSEIFIRQLPLNFLEILTNQDLYEFVKFLFQKFNKRKKKKFFMDHTTPFSSSFFIGNFSLITLCTDDRPFLLDSIREYFFEAGINQQFILHPIYSVKRNVKGEITSLKEAELGSKNESFVVVFLENVEESEFDKIQKEIKSIYNEVILTVDDFPDMNDLVKNISETYKNISPEVSEFLDWLMNDNFILQGVRILKDIDLKTGKYDLEQFGVYKLNRTLSLIPSIIKAIQTDKLHYINNYPVIVDKSVHKSKVKKRINYDRVMITDFNDNSCSVITLIGVFSKEAINTPPYKISLLRKTIADVFNYFKFVQGSHDFKWIRDIVNYFPKTEIFNFDKETLIEILETVLSLQGKNQIRLYWKNFRPLKNFYMLLAIPSEKFSNELINDLKKQFTKLLNANVLDSTYRSDEHGYHFIHFHLYLKDLKILDTIKDNDLKGVVQEILRDWNDELYELLSIRYSGLMTDQIYHTFVNTFSENYRTKLSPKEGAFDISNLVKFDQLRSAVYHEKDKIVLKIYSEEKILLTDIMPIINNIGLKVHEQEIYHLSTQNKSYYISNIYLADIENIQKFAKEYSTKLPDMLTAAVLEKIENDKLNNLLIQIGLDYREIDILRAIRNYVEQINYTFSKQSINNALLNNPKIAEHFVNLFDLKFNPCYDKRETEKIQKKLMEEIESISSVLEDTILRHLMETINAMTRTNYYQTPTKNYISFKIKSYELDILPDPKPMFEIYVHGPHVEGVHLRGGKVARGGLRFSDRFDDFRTEILGLLKTQMVKNTIIVPVGSKGGFIVKKRFADIDQDRNFVIEQYKNFIRGLLDITDNYSGKDIIQPENTVIYDEKDPYLVVAADKGTATFSDIANSVSKEYKFWLGDAFASGGSAGYDHKKVGITARGAWESVKRHFRELGKNISEEVFTVAGIGDMSGDVFGNGMLLSKKIKLLGAFNHMHIFVDPDPDPEISFLERERLFKLPKSTWKDYNESLISEGGGVFDRSAKRIKITPQMKKQLNISANTLTGEELIREILKAPVELLWSGGIGTYVKSTNESNEEVGDKANDNVRVNASDLKCKVIGEGGNLALTQKARIEFALNNGLINTDAIDNSGGVDMSDHEVNLKIFLDILLKNNVLKSQEERNNLIHKLTDEVTDLVLEDNYEQSEVISCDLLRSRENSIPFESTAKYLKDIGLLKFNIENINFIKEKRTISRPELAVLMSYVKIHLYDEIVNNVDLEDDLMYQLYRNYFPKTILEKYEKYLNEHRLKNEITATMLVNKSVNQAGTTIFPMIHNSTGTDYTKLMKRYIFADNLMKTDGLRKKIRVMDYKINTSIQYYMLTEVEKTLKVALEWLLNDKNYKMITEYPDKFTEIKDLIPKNLTGHLKNNFNKIKEDLMKNNCTQEIAESLCNIRYIKPVFDLFEISVTNKLDYKNAIENYFVIGEELSLHTISTGIKNIPLKTSWDSINRENLLKRSKNLQKHLAKKTTINSFTWFEDLMKNESVFFMNYKNFLESIENGEVQSLVPFNVIIDSLFDIINKY